MDLFNAVDVGSGSVLVNMLDMIISFGYCYIYLYIGKLKLKVNNLYICIM